MPEGVERSFDKRTRLRSVDRVVCARHLRRRKRSLWRAVGCGGVGGLSVCGVGGSALVVGSEGIVVVFGCLSSMFVLSECKLSIVE